MFEQIAAGQVAIAAASLLAESFAALPLAGCALSGWARACQPEPGADDAAGRIVVAGVERVVVI